MRKLRLATYGSLVRLAILLVLLGLSVFGAWWTMIRMPLKSYSGPLPPLDQEEIDIENTVRAHVAALAREIGERNVFHPKQLQEAAGYIRANLAQAGYEIREDTFSAAGETCANLEVEIPGREKRDEIVVVGAHYDSVSGCPGANDNASAVAALLVLAKGCRDLHPSRTLRFVSFVNEEPPFFQTDTMGSLVYAKRCQARRDQIVAMLSLETIGYYSDRKGSQRYPFPVGLFYPDKGDFIAFVGNTGSAGIVRRCVASFRRQVSFPSEGGALPGWMPGIGWSDHWSFWQAGYSALMVTDTAPFRYPHYHTQEDTPEKLDYARMARVVVGLKKVLGELTLFGAQTEPRP